MVNPSFFATSERRSYSFSPSSVWTTFLVAMSQESPMDQRSHLRHLNVNVNATYRTTVASGPALDSLNLPVGVVDCYLLSANLVDSTESEPDHLDNAPHRLLANIRLNRTLRSRRIRHHYLPDHIVLAW